MNQIIVIELTEESRREIPPEAAAAYLGGVIMRGKRSAEHTLHPSGEQAPLQIKVAGVRFIAGDFIDGEFVQQS